MATACKLWRQYVVKHLIFYGIYLAICVRSCDGFDYSNDTQVTLCAAQCEALCLDHVVECEEKCNGSRHWITSCDGPNCLSTCSVLYNNQILANLVPVPNLAINRLDSSHFELSWQRPITVNPNYTVIYIVEQTKQDPIYQSLKSVALVGWVRNERYKVEELESCSGNSYRIMAINQFGSLGFSTSVNSPGMTPGLVQNISFTGKGIYYYNDKDDPAASKFMAVLQWEPPRGWSSSDVSYYEWNPIVRRYCTDPSHDSIPLLISMKNQTDRVLMTIAANSLGCSFTTQVRAVSRCNQVGPYADFIVDLTNCSSINGYTCQAQEFDPPGLVTNVSLSISATPFSDMTIHYENKYIKSPLLINLHIQYQPPTDRGSQGIIKEYIIRTGRAERTDFPIPPYFIEAPDVRRVNNDVVEVILELPTQRIPYDYGVQVIAVAPGQVIRENEWELYPMYTIQVERNDSLATLQLHGTILLDAGGIVILYVNNTLPAQFIFDSPIGRSGNETIDRYALQWGPLVGPEQMQIENITVIPANVTIFPVFLNDSTKEYGVKVIPLSCVADEPSEEEWDNIPLHRFNLPLDPSEILDNPQQNQEHSSLLNWLSATAGVTIFLLIVMVTVVMKKSQKGQRLKNLERRLMQGEEEDVDENGDHYYIMRSPEDTIPPTFVTDRWELPHRCLKIGRTIGSGAFGQVVKGRVSQSILGYRGIPIHAMGGSESAGTHVTVAIKMLHESSDERNREDFLKEIQMMKDIGYHRNIVSILGCCTLQEPYCLVVEHVPHGDLLTYLCKIRQAVRQQHDAGEAYLNSELEMFTCQDLLSVARQISTGMEFLSQKGYIHRDLAARNILVGNNKTVKIGDFGLTRYIYNDVRRVYVNRHGGKLPLKWMSPEAVFSLTFSAASDVWSFGIVLFEIVTLGGTPYQQMSYRELLQALRQGTIMEKPDNCSDEIYDVMRSCWQFDPSLRPSFTRLREIFTTMLEETSGRQYFEIIFNEDRPYHRIESDQMDMDVSNIDVLCDEADGKSGETCVQKTEAKPEDRYSSVQTLSKPSFGDNMCISDQPRSFNKLSEMEVYTEHVFKRTSEMSPKPPSTDSVCGSDLLDSKAYTEHVLHRIHETLPKPSSENSLSSSDSPDFAIILADVEVYTDHAFERSQSQSSSFHNELYMSEEDLTEDATFSSPSGACTRTDSMPETSTDAFCATQFSPSGHNDQDRAIVLTDDVFSDDVCPGCKKLSIKMEDDCQCEICLTNDIRQSGLESKSSNRAVSPSISFNSVESGVVCGKRYPSSLSDSSSGSNDYLMPESPCLIVYSKIDDHTLTTYLPDAEKFHFQFMTDKDGQETYMAAVPTDNFAKDKELKSNKFQLDTKDAFKKIINTNRDIDKYENILLQHSEECDRRNDNLYNARITQDGQFSAEPDDAHAGTSLSSGSDGVTTAVGPKDKDHCTDSHIALEVTYF